VINEVMIDAASDRDGEYIELLNLSSVPRSLAGLEVLSNRGEHLVRRALFQSGCLAPMGTIVIFSHEDDWIWKPAPMGTVRYQRQRLGFSNDSDFVFELRMNGDLLLDQFAGDKELIQEGISLNRIPDGKGVHIGPHTELHGVPSSPGLSAESKPFRPDVVSDIPDQ